MSRVLRVTPPLKEQAQRRQSFTQPANLLAPNAPRKPRTEAPRQTHKHARKHPGQEQSKASKARMSKHARAPAQLEETGVAEVLGGHPVLEQDRRHRVRGLLYPEHPGNLLVNKRFRRAGMNEKKNVGWDHHTGSRSGPLSEEGA